MAVTKYLSSRQAAAHLQITRRKLQYWAGEGILEGHRQEENAAQGQSMQFGRRALLMARILNHMTEHVSLQALRPHIPELSEYVSDLMWFQSPDTWIVVMLSDFAVKRIERLQGKKRFVELAVEGPMFAIKVPMAWQRDRVCSER